MSAALKLFSAPKGPVLVDFNEEAPTSSVEEVILSCPVNFDISSDDLNDADKLRQAFKEEMNGLRSWYETSVKKRGRTTVGVSGLELNAAANFVGAFLDGVPDNPRDDMTLPFALNFAVDDLKAYYFEAISAQPGNGSPGSEQFADFFWDNTAAGKLLYAVKNAAGKSEDSMMKLVANMLLVPAERMMKIK
jgi:hypothetical protein